MASPPRIGSERYSSDMAAPRDTSPEAYAVLIDALRAAGPEARVAMAADMSDAVRELAIAGIRRQHPGFNDAQAGQALLERLLDPAAQKSRT